MRVDQLDDPSLAEAGSGDLDAAPGPPPPSDARRYFRACGTGGSLAIVVFVAMFSATSGFFSESFFSAFYEVQARSLRGLHWNVPAGSLGIEAFRTGSKYYQYYGPWPAVLRIPLMVAFPGMDGRWTQLLMTLALGLALFSASRLSWRIRGLVRGDVPVTRAECWTAGTFIFALGAGSVLMFLSSQAWVYHEAEIWGAALAIAAFDVIFAFAIAPTRRRLVWASTLSALSILSRPSVGFGPIVALLLLAGAWSTRRTTRWAGLERPDGGWRLVGQTAGAAGVPIALYMYVNYAKFKSLFVFPSTRQIYSTVSTYRQEMLARNHNSLFGFKFFPTALLQYLRPDALHFRQLLPWVDFPRTAPVIGHVLFDTIEPTSSVPSSMPMLFVLGIIGFVAIARSSGATRTRLPALRILVVGGFAGAFTVIPYSYIAQRYMSDFVPLLVISSLAGMHVLLRWAQQRPRRHNLAVTAVTILAALSVLVNVGLAYSYHYETELVLESNELTKYVNLQYSVRDHFPGAVPYVERGDALPYPPKSRGTVFVLGDCAGVYWSEGNTWPPASKWNAVARTEATGEYHLRMIVGPVTGSTPEPILVRGDRGRVQTLAVFVEAKSVQFAFASEGHDDLPQLTRDPHGFDLGHALRYTPGKTYDLDIVMDPNNGGILVVFGNEVAYAYVNYELTTPQLSHYVFPTNHVAIGRNDVGAPTTPTFRGSLVQRASTRPEICAKLGSPPAARSNGR